MSTSEVQNIPFERLARSTFNPRTLFDPDALKDTAASIDANGVLQNLVARPKPANGKGKANGKADLEIVAGERRYRAFGLLVKSGKRKATDTLPVRVAELDDLKARELALVENVEREDLHPMDEAHGYADLRARGRTVVQITSLVPFSRRHVELRLRLADNLCKSAKRAFLDGAFDTATARVIATACPKGRQDGVIKLIKKGEWGYASGAEQLRRTLLDTQVPVERALFERDLYKGPVTADPADEGEQPQEYFADPEAFLALQLDAVEAKKAELEKLWSWVEVVPRDQGFHDWNYGRSKNKKKAGVIIDIGYDYRVKITEGLMRPEDKAKAERAKVAKAVGADPEGVDPAKRLPTKRGIVLAKQDKTLALRAALMTAGAETAMVLACIGLLQSYVSGPSTVQVKADPQHGDNQVEVPGIAAIIKSAKVQLDGFREEGYAAAFDKLSALPSEELERLFTALVANQVGTWPGDGGKSGDMALAARLGEVLDVDVSAEPDWRLDEERLKAFTKPGLSAYAAQLGQGPDSYMIRRTRGQLRTEILKVLETEPDKRRILPAAWRFGSDEQLLADAQPPAEGAEDSGDQSDADEEQAPSAETPGTEGENVEPPEVGDTIEVPFVGAYDDTLRATVKKLFKNGNALVEDDEGESYRVAAADCTVLAKAG